MFRIKKSKTFFKDRVKKLMRKKKNDKLKSIIENEETFPTFKDSTGMTLLHMAAIYNNREMIQYLIDSGCEIDAKDSTGTTPLMIATKLNHSSVIKCLLDVNSDIFTTNLAEEYSLQLVFDRNRSFIYRSVINAYCEKVINNSSSLEQSVEVLLKAGCSLDQAAIMQNTEISRIILSKVERFGFEVNYASVLYSMSMIESANLEVLLTSGPQVNTRIGCFFWFLRDITNTGIVLKNQEVFHGERNPVEIVREFATKVVEWKLLNETNLKFITHMFEDADKDIIRVLLESGIVPYAHSHLNYNLLKHIYGNRNSAVIELLQSMGYNSETCSKNTGNGNLTALHIAVSRCIPSNVKLLLDMGADPNVADQYGEVPLFCVINSDEPLPLRTECVHLLLKSNADVEICDNRGNSFIEYIDLNNNDHLALVEPVLAHIAMLEIIDSPVKQSTLEYIKIYDELRNRYEICQQQLEEMKVRIVGRSVNLLTILISQPEKMARFVGAQIGNIITALMHGDSLRDLNEYYSLVFKDCLDRALKVNKLRCQVDDLIVESIEQFRGHHTIVDQIISHFNFQELLFFA